MSELSGDKGTVFVVGGDGYLGWPMAMYLSDRGWQVVVVDNGARRLYDEELGLQPLVDIPPIGRRVVDWHAASGHTIGVTELDVYVQPEKLYELFEQYQPDVVIHFGEQRAAPFSMIERANAAYTQENNIVGTLNILWAMKEVCPGCHMVKLGSMGVYGQPNIDIEEGFLEVYHNERRDVLPYPMQPGSWYHLTKVADSHNIQAACK
jgi:UDP-sulfoquinovose synthase